MENEQKQEGISLKDICRVIWKNIILVAIITVVFTALGTIYAVAIAKPTYSSTSTVVVAVTQGSGTAETTDYVNSLRVVTTVGQLMEEDIVLEKVADDLESYLGKYPNDEEKRDVIRSIKKMISTSYSTSSFLVTITVTSKDPELSKRIANYTVLNLIEVCNDPTGNDGLAMLKNAITQTTPAQTGSFAGPNRKLYVLVSFVLGLVVSFVVVFIKEFLSSRFKTKEEVKNYLGLEIVGTFVDNKKKAQKKKGAQSFDLLDPSLRNLEPFNKLLANIKYSNLENPYRVVMVTSTEPDELKSTTLMNAAQTIALNDKKVIVIDLDIRKPVVHKYLGISKENGLVEYIEGTLTKEEIIKHGNANVDAITVGKEVLNPLAVIEAKKLKELIALLREEYDYVLIDTPPMVACNDAVSIGHLVDGAIFNVSIDGAKKKDAKECVETLQRTGTTVVGISITKLQMTRGELSYYNSYYTEKSE